jgi:hypothetical protein
MPSMVHNCTAYCNRVLPRADLGVAARVGTGTRPRFLSQTKSELAATPCSNRKPRISLMSAVTFKGLSEKPSRQAHATKSGSQPAAENKLIDREILNASGRLPQISGKCERVKIQVTLIEVL